MQVYCRGVEGLRQKGGKGSCPLKRMIGVRLMKFGFAEGSPVDRRVEGVIN